jgi:hypothetical protein
MKKLVIGMAALALSLPCLAQETPVVVGLHIATYHDVDAYENFNPGVYIRIGGWTAGSFHNSLYNNSVYVGHTWDYRAKWLPNVVDSLSVTLGLISGYRYGIGKTGITPLVAPSVAFEVAQDTRLRVVYTPAISRDVRSTSMHFMLERTF